MLPQPCPVNSGETALPVIRDTNLHLRWAILKPPLRPNGEVVDAVASAISRHDARVLLLGVTPEFSGLGASLVAIDQNSIMIEEIWPGDRAERRALRGDWRAMPVPEGDFSAVIGDGSLGVFKYPSDYGDFYRELARVMRPGARLVVRVYAAPDTGEAVSALSEAALSGRGGEFSAFKWRLAMAQIPVCRSPNVPVRLIGRAFDLAFPDRDALARATGWSAAEIGSIDQYAGSDATISFPTRDELLAIIPDGFANPRFAPSGHYELAECCPLFIMDYRP
jgi:SAM-dependent methyltransferase